MDFNKKMKIRKNIALVYILIGVAMILLNVTGIVTNDIMSSFGLMLFVMGIARMVQYKRITADSESLNARRIAENDERNVMLWTKARSITTSVYLMLSALAVIVLYIINMQTAAQIVSYCMISFVVIYWICYFIVSKKY